MRGLPNKSLEQTPRKLRFFGKASVMRPIVAALLRLGVRRLTKKGEPINGWMVRKETLLQLG